MQFDGMKRRGFITLLGGAAAWPLAARAQQSTVPVIGFLSGRVSGDSSRLVVAFRQGLGEIGYVEGQNVAIEYRWAEGQYDPLPALASELVHRQASLIFAGSHPAALAAKAATTTLPIVFTIGSDPVQVGLVASLNRPGGNITGVSLFFGELAAKRLEQLHDLVPAASVIAALVNPSNPNAESRSRALDEAARALGKRILFFNASIEGDIEPAFAAMRQQRSDALLIGDDPLLEGRRDLLIALAARHRLPAIYNAREFVVSGGLMSYGASYLDAYRQVGRYSGRILKGEKPAELPVVQPAKFELVINLKTAKALGLDVPWFLQQRADEVIE
jgi:putative tryptophan/tyrosine transport system substrate-binding protein